MQNFSLSLSFQFHLERSLFHLRSFSRFIRDAALIPGKERIGEGIVDRKGTNRSRSLRYSVLRPKLLSSRQQRFDEADKWIVTGEQPFNNSWMEGRKEGRKQREDGGRLAKLTNKFSDTSNFNRSPLCLNALQIRCARVSQGTRTFACLFTTTTTVLAKSSRFSKDILPSPFSSSPRRVSFRLAYLFLPARWQQTFPRQNNFSRIRLARSKSRLFLPSRPYTRQKTRQDGRVSRRMEIPLRGFRGYVRVCACMCAKFANARCVVVATREGEKMEG